MRIATSLALTALGLGAAGSDAGLRFIEEDFLSFDGGAIFDDRLSYDFSSDFSGTGDDDRLLLPGELHLNPDEALITVIDLAPGEFIREIDVIWTDVCGLGCTTLTLFGDSGSVSISNMLTGTQEGVTLRRSDLGEDITSFTISSFDARIEGFSVAIVPAPGGLAAGAGVLLCLTRRTRCRNRGH